jgi:hypothetical protein
MEKRKRMVTPFLERKAFEDIIKRTFMKYKDNLMCSEEIMNQIIKDSTIEIRAQLQGLSTTIDK